MKQSVHIYAYAWEQKLLILGRYTVSEERSLIYTGTFIARKAVLSTYL